MKLTQITHNDLDGYGASTVAASLVGVDRIEHVTRYSDVDAVVSSELARLAGTVDAETLLVTDIAVEKGFAGLIRDFAGMNAGRSAPHGLVVLDHHASSLESLERAGLDRIDDDRGRPTFIMPGQRWLGAEGTPVYVAVDESMSATKLCAEFVPALRLRTGRPGTHEPSEAHAALVQAVDAVDLWRRERPLFDAGEAVNEIFWEVVLTYVPPGHESHDAFVGDVLLGAAAMVAAGAAAEDVEAAGMRIRKDAVERLLAEAGLGETDKQRAMTSRMRVSRLLARSEKLFAEPFDGRRMKVCHGMDPGILQRTSDFMLEEGGTDVVVNVMRGGAMSFRSVDGQALELARRFGGGGHSNAAGARLGTNAVFSLDEAVRLMSEVMEGEPEPGAREWRA